MSADRIGKWPANSSEARKNREFVKVSRENMLRTIHGENHPVPITFFVSNDLVHMGEIMIPSGGEGSRASEPDCHKGDAVFYVEAGPVTFFLPDTFDTFLVEEGEAMYIPEGTRYQCINYNDKPIKVIFSIAPEI